jgi:hypothetical protein
LLDVHLDKYRERIIAITGESKNDVRREKSPPPEILTIPFFMMVSMGS